MAQLKDTVVSGSLRATDSLLTTTLQTKILNVPTSNGGTTYGPGTSGNILFSGGSTNGAYWGATTGITSLGTVTTGTWSATAIAATKGGTGQTTYTIGDILYCSAANTLSKLAGNTTTTRKFLRSVATTEGTAVAPAWDTVTKTDVGLSNVENTKLSTWVGSSSLTTCSQGTFGSIVTYNADSANTASTAVVRDASGNFSAGTITATSFSGPLTGNVTGDCSGSSGSCTGNAATATKATQDGSGNTITSYYCTLSTAQNFTGDKTWGSSGQGGKLNGSASNGGINSILIGDDVWLGDCNNGGILGMKSTGSNCGFYMYNSSGTQIGQLYFNGTYLVCNKTISASITGSSGSCTGNAATATYASYLRSPQYQGAGLYTDEYGNFRHGGTTNTDNWNLMNNAGAKKFQFYWETGVFTATQVKNAVWNDYAECRQTYTEEPGRCVTETSTKKMALTTARLQPGCKLTSDTYGTLMGETEQAKTPIAVAGRVLAYPYRNKFEYKLGAAVCSAPGGTIDIMTRDEIMMYPERIVGTVSEIPDYDIWYGGDKNSPLEIPVKGRIWIYVK